jgi:alkylation response protein AidB-like acyl-CoA dehydrogenase
MKLILDDEQAQLARSVRDFVVASRPLERLRQLRDSRDPLGFSRAVWHEMAELGWTGVGIPEAWGGTGLGFTELCILLEEAGRRLMPEPLLSGLLLGAQTLLLGGSEAQKSSLLPRIAKGETLVGLAYQERQSRFDLARVETTAQRTSNGVLLHGEKVHVLDGGAADTLVVSAREAAGITLFLVPANAAGLEIVGERRIDSRGAARVRLTGVEIGRDANIGAPGSGLELLGKVIDRATIGLSAEMLGAASQAFEDTVEYLKTRRQFDVPIGSFQALQHRAARLFIELSLARAAVAAAARAVDEQPERASRLASLAKARVSDTFMRVAYEAVQMHGGIGVTDEFHIGFYLKRARAAELTFGDAAWHRRRWAELGGY